MSEQHTPGPWTWNQDRPQQYDLCWLRGPNNEHILTLYGNNKITPDKRLIGAAPDLLSAAKAAHRALLDRIPQSVPNGAEACELLLHAITKAESEQSDMSKLTEGHPLAHVMSEIELRIFQAQERTTQREIAARQAEQEKLLAECEQRLQAFSNRAHYIFGTEAMNLFDFMIDATEQEPEPCAAISYAHCLNRLRVHVREGFNDRYLLDRIAPDHSEVIAIDVLDPQHAAMDERAVVRQENADRLFVELARVHNLLTLNAQVDYTS